MAEFVMKDIVAKAGKSDEFVIASCATSTEEIGNPVHYGTKRKLAEVGISCDKKRAVQLTKSDYDRYDYIIAMDEMNIRNIFLSSFCFKSGSGRSFFISITGFEFIASRS